jgi:cytidine deaminase
VRAVAIAGPPAHRPAVRPCGACRQVLAEFASADTPVLLAPPRGTRAETRTLGALLPESFRL